MPGAVFDLTQANLQLFTGAPNVLLAKAIGTSRKLRCPAPLFEARGDGAIGGLSKAWHKTWQPISTAPAGRDLAVVVEREMCMRMPFRCRRGSEGWINPVIVRQIDIDPTHRREWRNEGYRE
jgi:hypothetical protein